MRLSMGAVVTEGAVLAAALEPASGSGALGVLGGVGSVWSVALQLWAILTPNRASFS